MTSRKNFMASPVFSARDECCRFTISRDIAWRFGDVLNAADALIGQITSRM